jgi:CcmD family protein
MPVIDYLTQNSLYIVLIVVLVVWSGIYGYLFRIDKKLRQLERKSE